MIISVMRMVGLLLLQGAKLAQLGAVLFITIRGGRKLAYR